MHTSVLMRVPLRKIHSPRKIIWIGMSDTMRTDSLHQVAIRTKVCREFSHCMLGLIVDHTGSASTRFWIMCALQNLTSACYIRIKLWQEDAIDWDIDLRHSP